MCVYVCVFQDIYCFKIKTFIKGPLMNERKSENSDIVNFLITYRCIDACACLYVACVRACCIAISIYT